MNIKEELLKLREKISKTEKETSQVQESIDLDDKVDDYLDWYYENMLKGHYPDRENNHQLLKMRNLIEKMAVWYELRYPDYEIDHEQENTDITQVMFRNNPYINELVDEDSDAKQLDWNEFYNTNVFINSLPWSERCFFLKPRYNEIVYLNPNTRSAHLHLTKKGIVEMPEDISLWTSSVIKDEDLVGMHVRDVVKLFKEKGIELPEGNELEESIKDVDKWLDQREGLLNSVMYRIIERGGNRIGPRRGFLFAKEFDRDIDIPMMYAIDRSDPELRKFINEYIKAGGSKDLKCYIGYFNRLSKDQPLDTISIQDLILTQNNDAINFYTPEEDELHKRLINALIKAGNTEKQEEKQLKLERKKEKTDNSDHDREM